MQENDSEVLYLSIIMDPDDLALPVTLTRLIIETFTSNGGRATTKQIRDYVWENRSRLGVKSENYDRSIGGCLSNLKRSGRIEGVAYAEYRLISKGHEPTVDTPKKTTPSEP